MILPHLTGDRHYSSVVKMQLLVDGVSIPVAQMGPDFVFLREIIPLPPSNAIVVFQVDQEEERWEVRLPNGISADSKKVAIAPRAFCES